MTREASPTVINLLKKKGYFNATKNEKIQSGKSCMEKLKQLRKARGKYFVCPPEQRGDWD